PALRRRHPRRRPAGAGAGRAGAGATVREGPEMKALLPSVLLGLLAGTPAAAQPALPPRVCLASVDDKGNVRIRSFTGPPVMERTAKVVVDAGGGKREERAVKVGVRFAVEN